MYTLKIHSLWFKKRFGYIKYVCFIGHVIIDTMKVRQIYKIILALYTLNIIFDRFLFRFILHHFSNFWSSPTQNHFLNNLCKYRVQCDLLVYLSVGKICNFMFSSPAGIFCFILMLIQIAIINIINRMNPNKIIPISATIFISHL